MVAAVQNRVQGSDVQKADILEALPVCNTNFYRVFELYEPCSQRTGLDAENGKFSDTGYSLISGQTDDGDTPSVTFALYPDGTISDPYVDSETINAYRLENEMFDFFPEVEQKTASRHFR